MQQETEVIGNGVADLPEEIDREGLVREFYTACDVKHPYETHVALIREEINEVAEAVAHLLKEMADLEYVIAGAVDDGHITVPDDIAANLDALAFYYSLVPPPIMNEVFLRVHKSNMSKLVDGKPLRREDGKVLKGPNYEPPYLLDLV